MTAQPNPSQARILLGLLRVAGEDGIDPMQALRHADCFRLAARIPEVRKLIGPEEEIVNAGKLTVHGKKVGRYVLRKRAEP